jgi:hypothetical protein
MFCKCLFDVLHAGNVSVLGQVSSASVFECPTLI